MRLLSMLLIALCGCRGPLVFPCSDDSVCVRSGAAGGKCTASPSASTRYCAFTDKACPTGLRFDATAGEGLSGACAGGSSHPDLGQPPQIKWSPLDSTTSENFFGVGGYDAQHVWAVGRPGIYFTPDGGKTWKAQKTPLDSTDLVAVWARPGNVWIVGWFNTILHSTNDGQTWGQQNSPAMTDLDAIWGTDVDNLYVVGFSGSLVHSTNGINWIAQDSKTTNNLSGVWGSGRNDVYVVGNGGTILHSTDEGTHWTPQPSGTTLDLVGIWGSGPEDIYIAGDQQIILHKGTSAGWSTASRPTGAMTDLFNSVWGSAQNDVYVVGSGGTIVHSTDGQTWQPQITGASALVTSIWGSSASDVFAVGDSGIILHGILQ